MGTKDTQDPLDVGRVETEADSTLRRVRENAHAFIARGFDIIVQFFALDLYCHISLPHTISNGKHGIFFFIFPLDTVEVYDTIVDFSLYMICYHITKSCHMDKWEGIEWWDPERHTDINLKPIDVMNQSTRSSNHLFLLTSNYMFTFAFKGEHFFVGAFGSFFLIIT
ncbi:hypothetical protein ACJX0J_006961 [Zea mays]